MKAFCRWLRDRYDDIDAQYCLTEIIGLIIFIAIVTLGLRFLDWLS